MVVASLQRQTYQEYLRHLSEPIYLYKKKIEDVPRWESVLDIEKAECA